MKVKVSNIKEGEYLKKKGEEKGESVNKGSDIKKGK